MCHGLVYAAQDVLGPVRRGDEVEELAPLAQLREQQRLLQESTAGGSLCRSTWHRSGQTQKNISPVRPVSGTEQLPKHSCVAVTTLACAAIGSHRKPL